MNAVRKPGNRKELNASETLMRFAKYYIVSAYFLLTMLSKSFVSLNIFLVHEIYLILAVVKRLLTRVIDNNYNHRGNQGGRCICANRPLQLYVCVKSSKHFLPF